MQRRNKSPYAAVTKLSQVFSCTDIFFLCYCFFVIYYFKERTLFLDNAFQTFLLIQDASIEVMANRWPAIMNRILPYLATTLELKLEYILLSFSLNYFLIHLLVYGLLRKYYSNSAYLLLYPMWLGLSLHHGFFWCNSELILALALFFVWVACLEKKHFIQAAGLSIALGFLHPLMISLISFYLLLNVIDVLNLKSWKKWIPFVSFYLSFILSQYVITNWYDQMKKEVFSESLSQMDWTIIMDAKELVTQQFPMASILLLVAVFILFYKKHYYRLLILVFCSVFYLFLVCIPLNSNALNLHFYNEVQLYPIIVFSLLALKKIVEDLKPLWHSVTIILITFYSCFNWMQQAGFYTERIGWYEELSNNYDRQIIGTDTIDSKYLIMSWASAYESLIISTLNGKSRTLLITENPDRFYEISNKNYFLSEFKNYDFNKLNKRYFPLEEKSYETEGI